jgi:carbamoyltransferase
MTGPDTTPHTHQHAPQNVLGLCSTGHGAAAALVSARHGVRALTLDRFTGRKHSLLFSRRELADIQDGQSGVDNAIRSALDYSFNGFPPSFIAEDALLPFVRYLISGLPLVPEDIDMIVTADCHFAFNWGRVGTLLECLFPNAEIVRDLEHHQIHQWQAYLPSPFEQAAVLTADESGEDLGRMDESRIAMTLSHAKGLHIEVLQEHLHPGSSPGLLYAEFSRYLGFFAGDEGKTMGLASYGRDTLYRKLRPALSLSEDGSFSFLEAPEYLTEVARYAPRREGGQLLPEHADVAFAVQRMIEEIMLNAANALHRRLPGVDAICLAGGVALNSCANQRIADEAGFSHIYIAPNPGDNGHALACALYGAHVLGQQPRSPLATDYLGPPAEALHDLERTLADHGISAQEASADDIAALLAEGRILGLFQNGAEHGPRALGNRSILADPRSASMTHIVNARIKRRELFRPFAPVVLYEDARQWFDLGDACDDESPFMLRVFPVKEALRDQLAAITHVDGTARVQTLRRYDNPWLYDIIEAFGKLTGVPVLLNTSFNLAGKPIVETTSDAIECYQSCGMDGLLLGQQLTLKQRSMPFQDPKASDEFDELRRLISHAEAP